MEPRPLSQHRQRRKHSSTGNAFSSSTSPFSGKDPYDGVSMSRGGKSSTFGVHEYTEIFSGSPSSIPVLDLSSLDELVGSGDFRSSMLDYSNIFGGVTNDDVAVPYEELVSGAAKKTKIQIPADEHSPCLESSSQRSPEKAKKSSSEATDQSSIHSTKQQINMSFSKTSQKDSDEQNGIVHVAQLHAIPGFTHFVDVASPPKKKEADNNPLSSLKREVSRTWSFNVGFNNGLTVEASHVLDKPKVPSPSSHPCNPIVDSDPRGLKFPSFDVSKKTDGEYSPPLFDEELDENSAAALSAAALKKAVEQAQESIRIARMIMERQKENLQGCPKPRCRGHSKVKNDDGTRIDNEVDGPVESSAWETHEGLDSFPILTGINGKFAPSPHHTGKFLNIGKVEEVERASVKVEAANGNGDTSSEVVETTLECKTEALELGKVDNRDHVMFSIDKLHSPLEEIETLSGTLEQLSSHESKVDENNDKLAEGVLSTSNNVPEIGKRVDDTLLQINASVFIREGADDIAESSERTISSSSSSEGMQQQVMIAQKTNEDLSILLEEEVKEERDDSAGILLKHEKKFFDTEEMVLEDRKPTFNNLLNGLRCSAENDMLRLEGKEGEPEVILVVGEDQKNINVVHEQEMDGRKEEHETLERHTSTSEFDAGKTNVQKGEVAADAASVDSIVEIVDAHTNDDTSNVSSEIQEPCDVDINDKAEEYQAAVEGCIENGFISAGNKEAGKLFEQEVNEMAGTDSLRRCVSEENFVGSKLSSTFEGFSSDSSTDVSGLADADNEEKLPKPEDSFKAASKINNVVEEEVAKFDVRPELEETLAVSSSQEWGEGNSGDSRSNKEEVKCNVEEGKNVEKKVDNFSGASTRSKWQKIESSDREQRIEAIKKGREREKDRKVVERAIREARERAFAEAREKAERAAVERAAAEARQRVMSGMQEKLEKDSKQSADKMSTEAKIRAERAAVERATAEARERALEKAMSQKTYVEVVRDKGLKHSFSSSDLEKFDETTSESAQRRKARLERHQRIMERAAKALAEKNKRDLLAQKEQAEKNRLAESLDAEIKRWAAGKEGNLRALLSTLQYILGADSGWQPSSLTEIITTAAVKKAYRKATLCVHPDKLQQRGASIQQKYICEKVFDLLKAAWNRFNSEEN